MGRPRAREQGDAPQLRAEAGGAVGGDLDRIIHERMRLAIVTALVAHPSLSFNALKGIVGATDGNLSVHARKLEDAGYVLCTKSFEGRTPRTEYALTEEGKAALERYLAHMEDVIRRVRGG